MPISQQLRRSLVVVLFAATLVGPVAGVASEDPPEEEEKPGLVARLRARRLDWVNSTDAWLYIGPGAAMVSLQDTRMTPLVYSGFGAGLKLSDEIVRDRWIWPTTISAHYAFPPGPDELPGIYQNVSADIRSLFLWRLARNGDGRRIGLVLGGGVRGGMNMRFYDKLQNSASNSDVVVSIEAASQVDTAFTFLKRAFVFHVQIAAPLFSYVGRSPEYSLHGTAHYWLPPWSFPRVSVDAGLTWDLRWANENTARLLYTWDFYGMDEFAGFQVLRVGTHTLGITLGAKRM